MKTERMKTPFTLNGPQISRWIPGVLTSLALSFWATPALALSCGDITNMVNVGVPTNIVVQTIEESGETFSSEDVKCLQSDGMPPEIIAAAKARMESAQPVEEEVTAPKKSSASDDFDSTEAVGGTKRSGGDLADLPEEGGDAEGGDDPQDLDDAIKNFEDKRYLTASLAFHDMLAANTYPDKESKILFYMARSLYELGMYHSAQYYYTEVLKKGPSNPYFNYALPRLVTIARLTGDESDLIRIVAKIPPEEYPRQARNQLYYLLGLRLYKEDKLTDARKYFEQISEKSELYTRAKFLEGVIFNRQGKLKSAVRSFTEVVRTQAEAATAQELAELNNLRDLALLNIARIYYSIERFEDSKTWYGNVPRESRYWAQAQFEASWANFMLSDLNLTLGEILTVESPFFKEQEFVPEATVLKALTFFNLCEYNDVATILKDFKGTYQPMQQEMKDFVKQYSSEEGKKLADQAYDRYFGNQNQPTTLPKSFFVKMLRNQEFQGLVAHLDLMAQEEALIAEQREQWKDTVGETLYKIIAEDRERLKRRAGLVLLQEMAGQANALSGLLTQADIIEFEVINATAEELSSRIGRVDLADSGASFQIDFATSADKIYWPFNGEFWSDELGYYRYTERGSCK